MKSKLITKYVIITLIGLIICLAPMRTNAYGDPSNYGGKLSTNIGDEATYEITSFNSYNPANSATRDTVPLKNGASISFDYTQGIRFTFKLVTVNKSIPREIEHYYFQRTLYIPDKGTFTLPDTAIIDSQFTESAFTGPASFFGYTFPNSKNATAYYSDHLHNSTDSYTTTQYYVSSHNDYFSLSRNYSSSSLSSSPGYEFVAHEFNWKTGWLQYVYVKSVNASDTIFEFKTELISSHTPSKGLHGMTLISILPPFVIIAILTIIKRKKGDL